jgi:hypothetical protein
MPVPVPGEIHSTVDSRPRHRALVPSLNPIQYPCYKNKVHWQYPYPVPVIRNTVQSFFSFLRGSFYYSTGTVPVATYYENLFIDPPPSQTHTHARACDCTLAFVIVRSLHFCFTSTCPRASCIRVWFIFFLSMPMDRREWNHWC